MSAFASVMVLVLFFNCCLIFPAHKDLYVLVVLLYMLLVFVYCFNVVFIISLLAALDTREEILDTIKKNNA